MSLPIDSVSLAITPNGIPASSNSGKLPQGVSRSETPAERKLRSAAAEFESMLLSKLWKSMKSSFAAEDADSDDPAHDALQDWGIEAMSSAVGKAGGLGIAKLILKHLEPDLAHSQIGNTSASSKASAVTADTSL